MNREIKFRAWEKEVVEDGFTYGGGMYYSEECDEKRRCGFVIETNSGYSNDDFIWMQYTGLKDKNGKEIYEGDILKCIYVLSDSDCYHVGVVTYDELNTKFYSHSIKQEISRSMSGINKSIEVIGNKFDNPELLKQA
jgi:uncharacterized phage protein (TIGR01671 family)